MASQGPNTAGTGADDSAVGTVTWSNPGNVTASDNTYATAAVNSTTSHYLKATNFGFSIPAGSTIDGVVVEWERKANTGGAVDNSVKLVKAGSVTGSDKSTGAWWSTTESFVSFGASNDLWGATLSASDVNDSTFGAALSGKSTFGSITLSVDSCRITVYYTAAASSRQQTMTLLGCGV